MNTTHDSPERHAVAPVRTPARRVRLLAVAAVAGALMTIAVTPAHAMTWERGTTNDDVVDCRGTWCTSNGALDAKATCAGQTWTWFC
jgi:hypothetical protein